MKIKVTMIYDCEGDEKTCAEMLQSHFGTDVGSTTIKGSGLSGSFCLTPLYEKTSVEIQSYYGLQLRSDPKHGV